MKNNNAHTESTLVISLKAYDDEAFTYVYNHYKRVLLSVIHQIIADKHVAEDVLQDSFTAIWKYIQQYDEVKGSLFVWMMHICRNTAINKLKSKNFKVSARNDSLHHFLDYIDATKSLQENINTIGLRKQVALLKAEQKQILDLSYFKGFTQEEISTILRLPLGTVKTRIRNALISLRKKYI